MVVIRCVVAATSIVESAYGEEFVPRFLLPAEIKQKSLEARHGNEKAAFELYLHYTKINDDERAELWLRIAASGKWALPQYNLAHLLAWNKKRYDEARLWADRALRNGYPKAAKLIATIEYIQKNGAPPP